LLTFFASGLRESELAALKVQDLDLDAGAAKVWDGKGGKDGIVPLSMRAIAALREYFANVRPKLINGGSEPYVFLGRRGRRLTRQQIYYRVRELKSCVTTLGSPGESTQVCEYTARNSTLS
jgi:integrase/recombinase XerD